MRYRADIDGLRAVAVLAVVGYHAFPALVPGGFVGVDVFFVISGFLITSLLLHDVDAGRRSLRGFYVRRVRRLFPALAVVLAACLAAGWWLLVPDAYAALGRHALAGALFVSNLAFWHDSDYFGPAAETLPLLHLWSLGVEEQFYLLWPPLLLLARRFGIDTLRLTWVAALLSLAGCVALTPADATAAFYLPLTRFWELLAGGVIAHAAHARFRSGATPRLAGWHADALAAAGIAGVVASFWLLDDQSPFPGWRALLPVAGAVAIVAAAGGGTRTGRVLGWRPLVWIGLVSYPLYLWHWPLLSFTRIAWISAPPAWVTALAVAASVLLAALTWWLVERPLRNRWPVRRALWLLLPAMAVVAALAATVWLARGFEFRAGEPVRRYAHYSYDYRPPSREGTCSLTGTPGQPERFPDSCVDPDTGDGRPLVVLWGDSHPALLYPGVRATAGDRIRIAQFTRSGCRPYLDAMQPTCSASNADVLARLAPLAPEVVVLFAHWTGLDYVDADTLVARLEPTIQGLHRLGAGRVVVLGPAPKWDGRLPALLIRQYDEQPFLRVPQRSWYAASRDVHALDAALAARYGGRDDVTYVSAIDRLCDPRGCLVYMHDPDRLTTWDYGHLAPEPAAAVAATVEAAVGGYRARQSR